MADVMWCESCRMRLGIDVDCDIACHVHRPLRGDQPGSGGWSKDGDDIVTRLRQVGLQGLLSRRGGQVTTTETFNEYTLLADIIDKWGEYGAHADLMRWMIAEIERLRAELGEAYDACRYALADSPRWQALAETVVHTYDEARRA